MSWRWEGYETEVEQRMVEEGWELEHSFPNFDEAIDHADWIARCAGRPTSVVRDSEYEEPWRVWVQQSGQTGRCHSTSPSSVDGGQRPG